MIAHRDLDPVRRCGRFLHSSLLGVGNGRSLNAPVLVRLCTCVPAGRASIIVKSSLPANIPTYDVALGFRKQSWSIPPPLPTQKGRGAGAQYRKVSVLPRRAAARAQLLCLEFMDFKYIIRR